MKMDEFLRVQHMTYEEYCNYLQDKYGIGLADYMTKSFNPNPKCKRTNEGLLAHHKAEDRAIMLSNKEYAMKEPFEYQRKENIVYCDLLEHLLLHVKICEWPSEEALPFLDVGVGGVINFIVPELNDLYSGWVTGQPWRQKVHSKVIDDKDVYLAIMKEFVQWAKSEGHTRKEMLHTCFNEAYGLWSKAKNKAIFKELDALWK